jgi:riboflavin kinase/FMN adenylyltransferase
VTDTTDVKIEAHLFEFAGDIYDQVIEIRFLKKLRDEQKFASLDALKEQLHLDKINSLACL